MSKSKITLKAIIVEIQFESHFCKHLSKNHTFCERIWILCQTNSFKLF